MSQKTIALVIPLWNEERNLKLLIESIVSTGTYDILHELILVNNGSTDNSLKLLYELAKQHNKIKIINLLSNVNYGGGIYEGCKHATANYIGFIPGDMQISPNDVVKLWHELNKHKDSEKLIIKGYRTVRKDPFQTRFVSRVYTTLANLILGTKVRDFNGLPKIFPKKLLDLLPLERMKTFVFDAQLIATAHFGGYQILEIPVTFHARREGVSSWSGKRIRTYLRSIRDLIAVKKCLNTPGIKLVQYNSTIQNTTAKVYNLSTFTGGWIAGNFVPSLLQNKEFEAGIKYYQKGAKETWHVHKKSLEITTIVKGKVKMLDCEFNEGDIIYIPEGQGTNFEALDDTITMILKYPSVPGDKYFFQE